MGHYAQLDSNNKVINVIVTDNNLDDSNDGTFDEAKGIAALKSFYGGDTNWKKTSYNGNIRGRFAGLGYTYDATKDEFIAPAPPITLAQYNSLTSDQQAQWTSLYPIPSA